MLIVTKKTSDLKATPLSRYQEISDDSHVPIQPSTRLNKTCHSPYLPNFHPSLIKVVCLILFSILWTLPVGIFANESENEEHVSLPSKDPSYLIVLGNSFQIGGGTSMVTGIVFSLIGGAKEIDAFRLTGKICVPVGLGFFTAGAILSSIGKAKRDPDSTDVKQAMLLSPINNTSNHSSNHSFNHPSDHSSSDSDLVAIHEWTHANPPIYKTRFILLDIHPYYNHRELGILISMRY